MVAIRLASLQDVQMARQWVCDLAQAAGIEDAGAVALATGELGDNCVAHASSAPGLLWVSCKPGRLSLRFENPCERRPDWLTQKPLTRAVARSGGHGLAPAPAAARLVTYRWVDQRVIIRAEFSSPADDRGRIVRAEEGSKA